MAKKMPIGVKILAILSYIGAVFGVLSGILMLFGSAFIASLLASVPGATALTALTSLGGAVAIVGGITVVAFGVLYFFVGKGLWDGKNWARMVTLVFSAISALSSLVSFNIVGLAINGVIIWYLGFNKEAKDYFR